MAKDHSTAADQAQWRGKGIKSYYADSFRFLFGYMSGDITHINI